MTMYVMYVKNKEYYYLNENFINYELTYRENGTFTVTVTLHEIHWMMQSFSTVY